MLVLHKRKHLELVCDDFGAKDIQLDFLGRFAVVWCLLLGKTKSRGADDGLIYLYSWTHVF